jgi:biotin carboxylase
MRVLFLAPAYPPEMIEYTRGLAELGHAVYGVGDAPVAALPQLVRESLRDYLQVPRLLDENDTVERVASWFGDRPPERALSNWEPLVILAARLREHWGLAGMSVDTVRGFRDKQLMKERVAGARLRVPRARRARTVAECQAAAAAIGYPLIIKPIAGAGSADTYRCDDEAQLEAALQRIGHVAEASVEEFIEGEEFTYDTLCIAGVPVYENVVQYLPKPIEMRSLEWISPIQLAVRDQTQPRLLPGIELGRKVLQALGMQDGFTHMEWFLTPKGEAVFGEIACRPGGAHLVDMMNYTADIDLFREWARVVTERKFAADAPRRYNVAIIFKRAQGQGRISRIEGLEAWKRAAGPAFVGDHLLRPGTPRRNWKQTLLSDGHLIVRHPEWQECLRLAKLAATDVRLYAE